MAEQEQEADKALPLLRVKSRTPHVDKAFNAVARDRGAFERAAANATMYPHVLRTQCYVRVAGGLITGQSYVWESAQERAGSTGCAHQRTVPGHRACQLLADGAAVTAAAGGTEAGWSAPEHAGAGRWFRRRTADN